MRTLLMIILLAGLATPALAQKFGHIDSQALLEAMPERDSLQTVLQDQATMYDAELTNMQGEFQKKYEDYLAKGATLPQAIRTQRETELRTLEQGMQDAATTFQTELGRLEQELFTPMIERAKTAIEKVGETNGFTYIFDVSVGATLYNGGEDIMPLVKAELGIK